MEKETRQKKLERIVKISEEIGLARSMIEELIKERTKLSLELWNDTAANGAPRPARHVNRNWRRDLQELTSRFTSPGEGMKIEDCARQMGCTLNAMRQRAAMAHAERLVSYDASTGMIYFAPF